MTSSPRPGTSWSRARPSTTCSWASAQNVRDTPEAFTAPPYFATVTDGDRVVAVALQTPPFQLVLSEIDDPAAIPLLADDLVDRDLPGAIGPVDHVRAFMEERAARGGPTVPSRRPPNGSSG